MAPTTTKLPDDRKKVNEQTLDHEVGLYRHKKRPQWGVAILAWEKGKRRAYQFQDGRLRKFREGYYSLMEPVDGSEVERTPEAVMSTLQAAVKAKTKGMKDSSGKELEPVAPFEAQVKFFLKEYPGGFKDPDWISEHRGDGPGRTLKRHREPAKQEAQKLLTKERCDELIEAGRHGDLVTSVHELLASTSLVSLKRVKPLRDLDEDTERRFAESVRELLHGEGEFEPRLEQYLEVLEGIYGGKPSWRIATVLPALYYPEEHVCVRRSAFARQAASVAPLANYSRRATVKSYKNFLRVAFAVRTRLAAHDLEPRDMLDIHDFVWATLRNAALDELTD